MVGQSKPQTNDWANHCIFFGRVSLPALPKLTGWRVGLPQGHGSLREAFALPQRQPAPKTVFDEPPEVEVESVPPVLPVQRLPNPTPPFEQPPIAEPSASHNVSVNDGSARAYRLPDLSIFDSPPAAVVDESNRAHLLEDTLASFGVGAKVVHIERGPSITRYELKPERGIKISKIASLSDDLALALAATSVRIEAPIPGKSAVGIEVPNQTVSIVAIREILEAIPNRGQIPAAVDGARQRHHRPSSLRRSRTYAASAGGRRHWGRQVGLPQHDRCIAARFRLLPTKCSC